ncbi:hypothetical protein [Alcaligenes faecalis]|uniref:hypothetical protein n=1 Tax=Alcaligenes faecalis TaxID=511 RepID=UPI00208DE5D4|nr:hypothetical protein [Alcaligenes faecalis]USP49611.1 hypothetical protein J5J84_09130 [Alcaligenes faecalis]
MPALTTLLARKWRIAGEQALAPHKRRQAAFRASKNRHCHHALAQNVKAKHQKPEPTQNTVQYRQPKIQSDQKQDIEQGKQPGFFIERH